MTHSDFVDWDDAFQNGAYIPNAEAYPPRWAAAAAAFRGGSQGAELDLAYGPGPRHRIDLFPPDGPAKGVVVFVHGGYWRAFDKSSWSHLAAGPRNVGWVVALPSYTLAPDARIAEITAEIARAITTIADRYPGPIRLAGHSAGGHLVSRMLSVSSPLAAAVQARIAHVVSISGLHDLRALRATEMNADLRLDPAEAVDESPALTAPIDGARITAWVGAQERPEFLRQTRLLEEAWARHGADISAIYEPHRHHFNVIDGLADPASPLCQKLLG